MGYCCPKSTLLPSQPPIHPVFLEISKISTLMSFVFLCLINLLLGIKHFSRAKFMSSWLLLYYLSLLMKTLDSFRSFPVTFGPLCKIIVKFLMHFSWPQNQEKKLWALKVWGFFEPCETGIFVQNWEHKDSKRKIRLRVRER